MKNKFFQLFVLAALLTAGICSAAPVKAPTPGARKKAKATPVLYEAKFVKGGWKAEDWDMVRSWRFDYSGKWIQKAQCIENVVPADATKKEMLGKRAGETYTAMLLKKRFKGNCAVTCTMEFDDRMAPGILIAAEPVKNGKGLLELREHFEVILYDDGLNVWHHFFEEGKQKWRKQHYLLDVKSFAPNKPYTLTAKVTFTGKGPFIALIWNNREIGYFEPKMFNGEYRIGLVGCEGVNRFYDFKVTPR